MSCFRHAFAERTKHVNPSAIRELLKIVSQPDIISFAGGMPAPELFPASGLAEAAARALGPDTLKAALQYGLSEGYWPLRQWIATQLQAEGIQAAPQQVLITTGSQQAIDMLAKIYLEPGDEVVVSRPTFLGALQSFDSYQARYLSVPVDEQGMRPEVLAEILEHRKPKLIYALPTFQNPTGLSMSPERKAALYAIARRHGVPILEDDAYGDLYYEGERPSSIKALDDADGVILLRTFSKILAPGLRVAYAVLPEAVMSRILPIKQSADLHTSALNQVMVHEFLRSGALEPHLETLRTVYARRRDVMLSAMERHFPEGVRWTRPAGGLFTWVQLPSGMSAEALLQIALAQKVAFIPGKPFFADGQGENVFRLNFSNACEADIEIGIQRLGTAIAAAMPSLALA